MKNKFIDLLFLCFLTLTFTACTQTDVVANTAIKSFDSIIKTSANRLISTDDGYLLKSPNNTESFAFGKKISISFELAPFIKAGLDIEKLPENIEVDNNQIIIEMENKGYVKESNPKITFEKLVRNNRDVIGYHDALDHYGIALGHGHMFEWAKDIATNDKDIVFVLNPQPFIEAGVNVNNIDGFLFAKVETMMDGKTVVVDKLLKAYNIE